MSGSFKRVVRTTAHVEEAMNAVDDLLIPELSRTAIRWEWREVFSTPVSYEEKSSSHIEMAMQVKINGRTIHGEEIVASVEFSGCQFWITCSDGDSDDIGDILAPKKVSLELTREKFSSFGVKSETETVKKNRVLQ